MSFVTYDNKFILIINIDIYKYIKYEKIKNDSIVIYFILFYQLEFHLSHNKALIRKKKKKDSINLF